MVVALSPRILLLDIETAPNIADVWGLYDQQLGIPNLRSVGFVLCWTAKWYGEKRIMFASCESGNGDAMILQMHALLDEADIVVHYNGAKFDIPHLQREFLVRGWQPPSPFKQIDLLRVVRKEFRFLSNKLDFVCQQLGLGGKVKNSGMVLWRGCMADDPAAWREMEKYNRQDVVILERLYDKLKPWIRSHPNHGLWDDGVVCPKCGSAKVQSRGTQTSLTQVYQRFQCTDCGGWHRAVKAIPESRPAFVGL
jgi:RNase_H superfamily/Transposase zinc-ribbon domain